MAETPLAKKLQIKPGATVAVVNPPRGYAKKLEPLPKGARVVAQRADVTVVFAKDAAELRAQSPRYREADDLLWVCYPKGGVTAGTDINRDVLRETLGKEGLIAVALVAVDDTWSAMRFKKRERR